MKTPQEKYENDPAYHQLVSSLYQMIKDYQFTPSELREAALFEATKFEMERASELRLGKVSETKGPKSEEEL